MCRNQTMCKSEECRPSGRHMISSFHSVLDDPGSATGSRGSATKTVPPGELLIRCHRVACRARHPITTPTKAYCASRQTKKDEGRKGHPERCAKRNNLSATRAIKSVVWKRGAYQGRYSCAQSRRRASPSVASRRRRVQYRSRRR